MSHISGLLHLCGDVYRCCDALLRLLSQAVCRRERTTRLGLKLSGVCLMRMNNDKTVLIWCQRNTCYLYSSSACNVLNYSFINGMYYGNTCGGRAGSVHRVYKIRVSFLSQRVFVLS